MWIPPRRDAPAAAASSNSGVSRGLYTRSLTRAVGGICSRERGEPCSSGPWDIPIVVQLTIRSADAAASPTSLPRSPVASASTPPFLANSANRCARSTVRLAMVRCPTCCRTRASTTPRAAPPAPSTRTRFPVGSNPAASRSDRRKPEPSVLCPVRQPFRLTMVLTAPALEAHSSTSSRWGITASLWGTVTLMPKIPGERSPFTNSATSSGATWWAR